MKTLILILSMVGIGTHLSYSQVNDSTNTGTFTDNRDNHVYKWVRIGNQIWMAENLAYLPKVNLTSETILISRPFYYVYDYEGADVDSAKGAGNYKTYGVLYNWPAANESCPSGWHLPDDVEWSKLTNYLGGEDEANRKMKESGTVHWKCQNNEATNSSGFTALPSGCLCGLSLNFNDVGQVGSWWSSNHDKFNAGLQILECTKSIFRYEAKFQCFSVRCVKD